MRHKTLFLNYQHNVVVLLDVGWAIWYQSSHLLMLTQCMCDSWTKHVSMYAVAFDCAEQYITTLVVFKIHGLWLTWYAEIRNIAPHACIHWTNRVLICCVLCVVCLCTLHDVRVHLQVALHTQYGSVTVSVFTLALFNSFTFRQCHDRRRHRRTLALSLLSRTREKNKINKTKQIHTNAACMHRHTQTHVLHMGKL